MKPVLSSVFPSRRGLQRRRALGLAAVTVASIAFAAPAHADPVAQLPTDVTQALDGKALQAAAASAAEFAKQDEGDSLGPTPPDFSGAIESGSVHQIYTFSDGFFQGDTAAAPVQAQQQWVAAVQREGQVLGTIRVWKPSGGPAQLAQFTGDVELGSSFEAAKDDVVIEVPETSSFYMLHDDVITPVNNAAKLEVPSASRISDVQAVMAARVAKTRAESVGIAPAGGGSPVQASRTLSDERNQNLLIGGLVVAGLGAGVLIALRRRNSHQQTQ